MFGTRTEGDAAAQGGTAPAGAVPPRTPRGGGAGADFGRGRRELGRPGRSTATVRWCTGAAAPARAEAAGGGAGGYRRSLEKWAGPVFPQEVAVRGAQWFLPGSEVNGAPSGAGVPAGKAGAATPHPCAKCRRLC
ncbi:MAG: hypothetical protein ACLRZH_09730 [Ruthenibacterium lactatiformans]